MYHAPIKMASDCLLQLHECMSKRCRQTVPDAKEEKQAPYRLHLGYRYWHLQMMLLNRYKPLPRLSIHRRAVWAGVLSVFWPMDTSIGLRKDLRCWGKTKVLRRCICWAHQSVHLKYTCVTPGQGDRTRLHLNSSSPSHTHRTVGELLAWFAPHPLCSFTLATDFVCACVCVVTHQFIGFGPEVIRG